MVLGSRLDGGNQILSFPIKKTIQSIKEIVQNYSDAEIYAMLKETNMDPNETTQKLLNQDPFHEVRRKRDKKKELQYPANKGILETKRPTERNTQRAKPLTSWDQNAEGGGYSRNSVPDAGLGREFRIVRDNRANQNANSDTNPKAYQGSDSSSQEALLNVSEKSATGILNYQGPPISRNPKVHLVTQVGTEPLLPQGTQVTQPTVLVSASQSPEVVVNNSPKTTPTNSVIGLYSSSSDPVHVPSPDSRPTGNVGTIRREVGVAGVSRHSSDGVPISSSLFPSSMKDIQSAVSSGDTGSVSKINQPNQTHASEHNVHSMSISRPSSRGQYNNKLHQQSISHQKATQPNMEWKPKPSQKSRNVSPSLTGTISAPSYVAVDSSIASQVDDTDVLEKLVHINIMENQHVIIPQHLRVPESDRMWLTFGSFGVGSDSTKGFRSRQTTENEEILMGELSISAPASVPAGSSEDASDDDEVEFEDQAKTSHSDSPLSAETHQPLTRNESVSPETIECYEDIGLVQSHSPPYNAPEPQLQEDSNRPSFSAYDSQTNYDSPFFKTVMEDNVRGQGLSPAEALGLHTAISTAPSTVALPHQQHPIAQLYSQVQIPHIPNFFPYRHIFSPVYVPPMAIPSYPTNPSYPHPSNGSNYLLMPGGSSHLTVGGVKYGGPQYKQVPTGGPAGYGNYTNPSGFNISTTASIGGVAGLEDVTRIKYKDSNLYVPNPQAESPDIWIQTPRELPGLQSAAVPYYNLPGQAPLAPPFMPTHTGHPSFNAAVTAVQYPGLFHPQQQAAPIPNSHHLVHQPVTPGFGGGLGMAAPGPQLGTFQQPQQMPQQMSHLNWNFNV